MSGGLPLGARPLGCRKVAHPGHGSFFHRSLKAALPRQGSDLRLPISALFNFFLEMRSSLWVLPNLCADISEEAADFSAEF